MFRKKILKLTGIVAIISFTGIIACSNGGGSDKEIKLKLNLNEDSQKTVSFLTEQKIMQEFQGKKQKTDQTLKMTYLYNTGKKTAEGNQNIDIEYKNIYLKVKTPNEEMVYDSSDAEAGAPDFAKGYEALIGKSFSIVITPEGEVKEVIGIDKMIDDIIKNLAIMDNDTRARIRAMLKARFGADTIRKNIQKVFDIYPQKPVKEGDSWSRDIQVSMGYPMGVSTTYTLKKISGDIAEVEVDSEISNSEDMPEGPPGYDYKIDFSGNQSGKMKIDIDTGWINSSKVKQDIKGSVTVGSGEDKKVLPVSIRGTVKMSTLKSD